MFRDETFKMLKKVIFYDLILGYVITSALYFTYRAYSGPFAAGLAIASVNFFASGIITNNNVTKGNKGNIITFFINFFRILIICLAAFVFFRYNVNCVIAYILGFTSHFIALVLYALFNNDTKIERK